MIWRFSAVLERPSRPGGAAPAGPRYTGSAGFTLLELLAVLAILGLMMALVARYQPHWGKTLGLKGAATELAANLRLARSQAIAENHAVAVLVDVAGHRYRIDGAPPLPLPADLS